MVAQIWWILQWPIWQGASLLRLHNPTTFGADGGGCQEFLGLLKVDRLWVGALGNLGVLFAVGDVRSEAAVENGDAGAVKCLDVLGFVGGDFGFNELFGPI